MTIELQTKAATFSASSQVQSKILDFYFGGNVAIAQASIAGFDIKYASSDHHVSHEAIEVSVVKKEVNKVSVKVNLGLQDASGNVSEGHVDVAVLADTYDPTIVNCINGGSKVALRTSGGKYVSAEAGQGFKLVGSKTSIGDEETFVLELLDNLSASTLTDRSRVALRASNGRFVCAEGGGGGLVANRDAIGPWESFVVKKLSTTPLEDSIAVISGDKVALLSSSGQLVCAEGGGGQPLVANRARAAAWETFELIRL